MPDASQKSSVVTFFSLPGEIRNNIYQAFIDNMIVVPEGHGNWLAMKGIPEAFKAIMQLYLANKQIHAEARSVFFTSIIYFRMFEYEELVRLAEIIPREHWTSIHIELRLFGNEHYDISSIVHDVMTMVTQERGNTLEGLGVNEKDDNIQEYGYRIANDDKHLATFLWSSHIHEYEWLEIDGNLGALKCFGQIIEVLKKAMANKKTDSCGCLIDRTSGWWA